MIKFKQVTLNRSLNLLQLISLSLLLAPMEVLSANKLNKSPVSVSYQNLVRCFPELADERLSFKVDLNRLKEIANEKFVTSQSQLRQRKIRFVDPENKIMVLTLSNKFSGKTVKTELSLQKVDDKGILSDIKLLDTQRINPTQDTINGFLLNGTIKVDEYFYHDTKLNGLASTYRQNFKNVEEYELIDRWHNRSIVCENKPDLGIICTCSKK